MHLPCLSSLLLALCFASSSTPAATPVNPQAVLPVTSTNGPTNFALSNGGSATGGDVTSPLGSSGNVVVVGYYPDWTANILTPAQVTYNKLTHVNYAFANVDQTGTISLNSTSTLQAVVQGAHAANTKVLLSVGGWTYSQYFSAAASSAATRQTFCSTAVAMVQQYQLDGIDIDWEYPGRQGMSCSLVNAQADSANLLSLLQELRQALDSTFGQGKMEITLATRVEPFDGPNGPLSDVSAYATYVDRINVMAYDVTGGWSKSTGPNAPLDGSTSQNSAIQAWLGAKWPAQKIAMGLPFYGRALTTTTVMSNTLSGTPISSTVPQGDSDDAPYADPCPGSPSVYSGVWQWRHLRDQGVLTTTTTCGSGWARNWDSTSSTPWLYNASTKTVISYDDEQSLTLKVKNALCKGLNGVMIWDLHQDNGELLNAVDQAIQQGATSC